MASTSSLDNLNPIVVPDPVGLFPLATGWKVLAVLLAVGTALAAWRWWRARREDRYRREALRELAALPDARGVPALLRRTALSAFPRDRVAPLLGEDWHRFLDETARTPLFRGETGDWLDRLAYGGVDLDERQTGAVRGAARTWLMTHSRAA